MRRSTLLGTIISILLLMILSGCTMANDLLSVTATPVQIEPELVLEPTSTLIATRTAIDTAGLMATAVPQDPNRRLTFIMVQPASCDWDPFWCEVEKGIYDAAARLNVEIVILAPDEYDLQATASLIDQAIALAPDGIGLTLIDPGLFAEPVWRANEAGIPIMAYNAGSGPIKDDLPYFGYLGQDEYQSGYLSGLRLAEAGGTFGLCINQLIGSPNLDTRCRGFVDAFDDYDQTAEVLGVSLVESEATLTILSHFAEHPEIDAVLTLGQAAAAPYYNFLAQTQQGSDNFVHGTFDLNDEITTAILAGRTLFGIDQQPYLQGYGVVYWLSLITRLGIRPAAPTLATGPGFVDNATLAAAPDPNASIEIIAVQHARCDWDRFWCVVENGIKKAAAELGISVTITGPDSFDLVAMAQLIDEAIAAQPDAIMVTIPDARALEASLEAAAKAGIPVIAYNSGKGPILDDLPYVTYLGQDEYQGGFEAARRLVAAGGTNGVCINHQAGNENLDARCRGMIDGFNSAGFPAEVLEVSEDTVFTQGRLERYFSTNQFADAALTLGPVSAETIYLYLATAGRADILHGTFELSDQIITAIRNGTTLFAIDQQPYLQGYGSVTAISLMLRHGIVPALPVTPTGPGFVDMENIDIVEALAGEYR